MVVPNEGKVQFLATIFYPPTVENFVIELFKNDVTPDDDSVIGDFDVADFAGAGPWVVGAADWDPAIIVGDVGEVSLTVPPTWVHGGGAAQVVYGWIMYGEDTLNLFCAQRFDVPRNMTSGSSESLDPFTIKLKSFA